MDDVKTRRFRALAALNATRKSRSAGGHPVSIRFSLAARTQLQAVASLYGMGFTEWVRMVALKEARRVLRAEGLQPVELESAELELERAAELRDEHERSKGTP